MATPTQTEIIIATLPATECRIMWDAKRDPKFKGWDSEFSSASGELADRGAAFRALLEAGTIVRTGWLNGSAVYAAA